MKPKPKLRKQVCWMPWVVDENRFESWIFGSKNDCEEWIGNSNNYFPGDCFVPVQVEIKEVRRGKKS